MNKHFLFIGLSCLTACTVGPDYKRPAFVSDDEIAKALSLNEKASPVLRSDWYAAFEDEKLNALIDQALTNNPTLDSYAHKLKQARHLLAAAKVAGLPVFDVSGGYTKVKPSRNVAGAVRENYYTVGLDASWETDFWGAERRKAEAANAAVETAKAGLDDMKIILKAEVVSVYVSLRSAQERLRLLEQAADVQNSLSDIADSNRFAGLTATTDALTVHIATKRLKAQIPSLEQAVDTYKNALAVLAGVLPDALTPLTGTDTDANIVNAPFKCDLSALYDIPAAVIRHRPDVRAAESELVAANAEIGQAVAALYPNISLSALFGFQADVFKRLTSKNSHLVNLTPTISLPLFHWNALTNAVKAAEEGEQAQKSAYKAALLSAVRDLKDSMTQVNKSYAAHLKNKQVTVKARDLATLTMKLYRSGLVPLSDALQSIQNLLNARSSEIAGKAEVYQAVAAFYKAVGV